MKIMVTLQENQENSDNAWKPYGPLKKIYTILHHQGKWFS
jgi:hypothetical protein